MLLLVQWELPLLVFKNCIKLMIKEIKLMSHISEYALLVLLLKLILSLES